MNMKLTHANKTIHVIINVCQVLTVTAHGSKPRTRRMCGVPVTLLVALFAFSIIIALILLTLWLYTGMNVDSRLSSHPQNYRLARFACIFHFTLTKFSPATSL